MFICPRSQEDWLKANGANDSKLLTEESREAFFAALLTRNPSLGWRTRALHPEYISNCMLHPQKFNLNELSYATVFDLISLVLADNVKVQAAYVDTLGKAEKYEATLGAKFPGIRFTVRSKADRLYPVVGAASIVAKVIRDDILRQEGVQASGYPGDAATIAWLREHVDPVFGFPPLVRFSWSTSGLLLTEHCHPVQWLHDGEEGDEKEEAGEKEATANNPHRLHQRDQANRRKRIGNKENQETSPAAIIRDQKVRILRQRQQEHYNCPLGLYPYRI